MGNPRYRQKSAISEVQFFRYIDVSSADFDGTDAASMTTELPPSGDNMFGEGFYFMPETAGDVVALSYWDWKNNNSTINDAYAQTLPSCAAGIFHPTRVVKIYSTGTLTNNITVGV